MKLQKEAEEANKLIKKLEEEKDEEEKMEEKKMEIDQSIDEVSDDGEAQSKKTALHGKKGKSHGK